MSLRAEAPVYGGFVLARDEGVVFIRGAIDGETVEVAVEEKKRDYAVASVTEVLEPSPWRVEPPCQYFGDCGGCQLQHAAYEKQVLMKEDVLLDSLRRIGGLEEVVLAESLCADPFGYRRRAGFKISRTGEIGFFRAGTRDVTAIESCPLLVAPLNNALSKIRRENLEGVRELHLSSGDSGEVVGLMRGSRYDAALPGRLVSDCGLSGLLLGDGRRLGDTRVRMDLGGLAYSVSAGGFFQANWELNLSMISLIIEELGPLSDKKITDLYAGSGNFALPMAAEGAKKVLAVEENPAAVEDGRQNAEANSLKNCVFSSDKVEKTRPKADIAILDPPRPGLTDKVVGNLLEAAPARIVYVSCNPSTLARDLKKLSSDYRVDSVRLVDFFPNTYHLEAVAMLTLLED